MNAKEDINKEIEKNLTYLSENIRRAEDFVNIKDTEITSYRTHGSGLIKFFKRCIRKTIYWFIKPYWDQQIEYNIAVKNALADIYRLQLTVLGIDESQLPINGVDVDDQLREFYAAKQTRIIQVVASLNFGDAVGNDVIAVQEALKNQGFVTAIFAKTIHTKIEKGIAYKINALPKLRDTDIILYHFASEDSLTEMLKTVPCKVILRYHNVTPPNFFKGFDVSAERNTKVGLKQIAGLSEIVDYGMVVSDYNKSDLEQMGYTCPIDVVPILVQFNDYKKAPSKEIIEKYNDGITNLVFVGRMAPNKKVEDVISAFHKYKSMYDKSARLFLVGNYREEDKYFQFLQKHIKKLQVEDVIFPGHIPFDEILAYYSIADVFLCMSEHEGFCVPLVEAMFFNVPILAYNSTAIPSTLGGSGVLIDVKDFDMISSKIHDIVTDGELKDYILEKQRNRLKDFDHEIIEIQIKNCLEKILKENDLSNWRKEE